MRDHTPSAKAKRVYFILGLGPSKKHFSRYELFSLYYLLPLLFRPSFGRGGPLLLGRHGRLAHARLGLGYLRGLCRRSTLAPGERCVCGPVAQALKDRLLLCGQGVDEDVCPGAPPGCALLNSEMTSVVSARESLSSRTSQEALTWRGGRTG